MNQSMGEMFPQRENVDAKKGAVQCVVAKGLR
jgi:hypothetical protein